MTVVVPLWERSRTITLTGTYHVARCVVDCDRYIVIGWINVQEATMKPEMF
jgi:hypothetical protein